MEYFDQEVLQLTTSMYHSDETEPYHFKIFYELEDEASDQYSHKEKVLSQWFFFQVVETVLLKIGLGHNIVEPKFRV